MAKREAVLFDKNNYVYDITGQTPKTEEDKILDEIEKLDSKTHVGNADKETPEITLAELDKEWEAVVLDIQQRADKLSAFLNGRDGRALKSAALENKVPLLYALMENYDSSVAKKMQDAADYISGTALVRLRELQNSAIEK